MSYNKYTIGIPITCFTVISIINYDYFSNLFNSHLGFNNLLQSSSQQKKTITEKPVENNSEKMQKNLTFTRLKYFWGY